MAHGISGWQSVTGAVLTGAKPVGPGVMKGPVEEYDGWFWSCRCGQQGRLQGGGGVLVGLAGLVGSGLVGEG